MVHEQDMLSSLRSIKRSTLRHYAARFPQAASSLDDWERLVAAGAWQNLVETRRMFSHADQTDYLDLLSDLYEKWEGAQFPISRASGAKLLQQVLAERNEGGAHLARLLGVDPSLAYRLLRGERQLTAVQIRKVADAYGIDPVALLP